MTENEQLRIVTYNVGGGRDDFDITADSILAAIRELAPDILGLQECIEWCDANRRRYSFCTEAEKVMSEETTSFFGKTLSLRENFHPKKTIMLDALYKDWQDWVFGNALLARYPYTRFSDPAQPGVPQNLSIFKPLAYEGTRDTDPRSAIIGRVKLPNGAPFVVCTHFTTLAGERGSRHQLIPGKHEEAEALRCQQARMLLELLKPITSTGQMVILMGDFNAGPQEACISTVLQREGGFVRLAPRQEIPTHPKVAQPVDHIFVSPIDALLDYTCWIDTSTGARGASDHLPVVADIILK